MKSRWLNITSSTTINLVFGINYFFFFKRINKSKNKVVAIDIPSGVSSDTGEIMGGAIKADYTVTFHAKKLGHLFDPGKEFSGKIKVADIGFSNSKMKNYYMENSAHLWIKHFAWK